MENHLIERASELGKTASDLAFQLLKLQHELLKVSHSKLEGKSYKGSYLEAHDRLEPFYGEIMKLRAELSEIIGDGSK